MKLFCRHCWKNVVPKITACGHHVRAECPQCKKWIKFLNKAEVKTALKERLYAPARTRLQTIR